MMLTADEIAEKALRDEVRALWGKLTPEQLAAVDMVWPFGLSNMEEVRVCLTALQRMVVQNAQRSRRAA